MGSIALNLEKNGIPTAAIIYKEHEGNYMSAASLAGYGPTPTLAVNADEIQTKEGATKVGHSTIDFVVKALTSNQVPYLKRDGKFLRPDPEVFTFKGKDAEAQFNKFYLKMRWSDGLPLVAPTKEKVDWLLTGTERKPDEVIGTMGPSNGIITVRTVAINAALAGARPEHMPVILAAVEGIASYKYDFYTPQLRGVTPMIIVNGPIVKDLGISYRNNNLGPNPEMPAGGPIGRAVNFVWRNVGGFGYGMTPPSQHGQPGMFNGLVVAQSEWDTMGWIPYNQMIGFPAGTNTVTVIGVIGNQIIPGKNLDFVAAAIPPLSSEWPGNMAAWKTRKAGVLLVTPFIEGRLNGKDAANPYNMSQKDVAQFLADNATISRAEFVKIMAGGDESKAKGLAKELLDSTPAGKEIPIIAGADNVIVLDSGGWCSCVPWVWLSTDQFMSTPVTKMVKLPQNWNSLLEAAK